MAITFPRVIPGDTVGGRKFKGSGDIDGGFKTPTELGLNTRPNVTLSEAKSFDANWFGGNCDRLGLNKETGLYVCRWTQHPEIVCGIWIGSLESLTDKGRALVENHYGYALNTEWKKPVDTKAVGSMSAEEAKEHAKIRKKMGNRKVEIPQFNEPEARVYASPDSLQDGRF